jgi:hypothetical protein
MSRDELAKHAFNALARGRLLILTADTLPPGFPRGMLLCGDVRMFEPGQILRWIRGAG